METTMTDGADRTDTHNRMRQGLERLRAAGHPAEEIKVFGSVSTWVHVTCSSRTVAEKWRMALARIGFGGLRVSESLEHTATNAHTVSAPSVRTVWRVGGAL